MNNIYIKKLSAQTDEKAFVKGSFTAFQNKMPTYLVTFMFDLKTKQNKTQCNNSPGWVNSVG